MSRGILVVPPMSTQLKSYLLVVRDRVEDYAGLDDAAMAAIVARYREWAAGLAARGRLAGGQKLAEDGGCVVRGNNGRLSVQDGPYAEAREVVGGYFVLLAADDQDALSLLADHPHLATRGSLELRAVDPDGDAPAVGA